MMGETLKDIDDEVQRLEGALRGLAKLEPMVKEQETLVTKTLTLDEVRRELEEWKEPIKSEYESLLKHKAIEPINREQYQELQRTHDIEVIRSLWQQSSRLSKEKQGWWHVAIRLQRMKMRKWQQVDYARCAQGHWCPKQPKMNGVVQQWM